MGCAKLRGDRQNLIKMHVPTRGCSHPSAASVSASSRQRKT